MNANEELIETLAKSELYQQYERAYTEAMHLPLTLRPVQTWELPLHGKKRENPFCSLIAQKSRTCAACLQMQDQLCQSAGEEARTMSCKYGLCETAVPIRLGEETIGYLQTGQVMRQQPTLAQFQKVVSELEQSGHTVDVEKVRTMYFQTPVLLPKQLEAITKLLTIFAEHLSMQSNQIAVNTANAEPPAITRAKQYIQEHLTEDLSLGQVAKAVNMSSFYFCKIFRKHTGINFTEFVSRCRIERARNLLLNPNLRISEIAFEVGFQSLTHFNRVFKKIMGEAPTLYRQRIPRTPKV